LRHQQFGTMFDHWLIQRCLVDAILEPTPSATEPGYSGGYSDWWFSVASYDLHADSRAQFRLRNDLYCVEWGVKLYSLTHSCTVTSARISQQQANLN